MERRRCKICFRSFTDGRALGGHMKSHLAFLPIPLKRPPSQLIESAESSSYFSDGNDEENKVLACGLRGKSFKAADPEFLDAGSVVDHEKGRESVTESSRHPTRKQAKRKHPGSTESLTELETASSVPDTFTREDDEEVALCLIKLSRDIWPSWTRGTMTYQCETCKKVFKSFQALGGHRPSHKRVERNISGESKMMGKKNVDDDKVRECPVCFKIFESGQALGRHKRLHFTGPSATPKQLVENEEIILVKENMDIGGGLGLIDLNLPAPMEGDEEE